MVGDCGDRRTRQEWSLGEWTGFLEQDPAEAGRVLRDVSEEWLRRHGHRGDGEDVAAWAVARILHRVAQGRAWLQPGKPLAAYFGRMARNVGSEMRRRRQLTMDPGRLDCLAAPAPRSEGGHSQIPCPSFLNPEERKLLLLLVAERTFTGVGRMTGLEPADIERILTRARGRVEAGRRREHEWAVRALASSRCNPVDREILEDYLRKKPVPEIAERLGMTPSAVKFRILRKKKTRFVLPPAPRASGIG